MKKRELELLQSKCFMEDLIEAYKDNKTDYADCDLPEFVLMHIIRFASGLKASDFEFSSEFVVICENIMLGISRSYK